jgi:proteasome lid subunit RPN8/RPN11
MLKITKNVYDAVIAHAKREAPIESCGYFAGKDGIVTELFTLTNTDKSCEHYSMDPAEQFAAVRSARAKGLSVIAGYHSHPASPARPSEEDIRLAYDPALLYAIISLAASEPAMKVFSIKKGEVTAVDLEVIDVNIQNTAST